MNLSDAIIQRLELEARKAARAIAGLDRADLGARTYLQARARAFDEAAEAVRWAAACRRAGGRPESEEPFSAVPRDLGGRP